MTNYKTDDLLIEIEVLKSDLSEAREIIDYYKKQEKEFIYKMDAIVKSYHESDDRDI